MKDITPLLQQLAEKLGTTVEYLWSVLIRQAQIDAFKSIILFPLALAIGIFVYKRWNKLTPGKKEESSLLWIFAGIVSAAIIIASTASLVININGLLNPEYWALKEVIKQIR